RLPDFAVDDGPALLAREQTEHGVLRVRAIGGAVHARRVGMVDELPILEDAGLDEPADVLVDALAVDGLAGFGEDHRLQGTGIRVRRLHAAQELQTTLDHPVLWRDPGIQKGQQRQTRFATLKLGQRNRVFPTAIVTLLLAQELDALVNGPFDAINQLFLGAILCLQRWKGPDRQKRGERRAHDVSHGSFLRGKGREVIITLLFRRARRLPRGKQLLARDEAAPASRLSFPNSVWERPTAKLRFAASAPAESTVAPGFAETEFRGPGSQTEFGNQDPLNQDPPSTLRIGATHRWCSHRVPTSVD